MNFSELAFRILLRAYPPSFRARYGTGMSEFKHLAVEEPAEEDEGILQGIEQHELAQAMAAEAAELVDVEEEEEAEATAGE